MRVPPMARVSPSIAIARPMIGGPGEV